MKTLRHACAATILMLVLAVSVLAIVLVVLGVISAWYLFPASATEQDAVPASAESFSMPAREGRAVMGRWAPRTQDA